MDAQAPVLSDAPADFSGNNKLWAIAGHLSLFLGIGLLVPLVILLLKRAESPFVGEHAREALNFHLSLLIYVVAFCIAFGMAMFSLIFSIVAVPVMMFLAVPFCGVIVMGPIVLAILASAKAANGEYFHYPLTLQLLR